MKKIFFLIILLSVFSVKIKAQTYGAWKFGGTGNQTATSIIQCADGGYIVVGNNDSLSDGNGDIFALRFDSNFNLLWKRTVGGAFGDYAASVAQADDGGFVIAGSSSSFSTPPGNDLDMYVVKLSPTGNLLWTKNIGTFTTGSYEGSASMRKTADGNFMIIGNTGYGGISGIMYLKIDQAGNILTQGSSGESWAQWNAACSIYPTADGGFAIAGEASATASVYEIYFVKVSNVNTLQWGKEFSAYTTPPLAYNIYKANDMIQTSDHGYAFTGGTNSYFDNPHLFFTKVDSVGNPQWVKYLNFNQGSDSVAFSLGTSIIQTADGGFAVAGFVQKGYNYMRSDIIFVRYDASGNILWSKIIGDGGADERATHIIQSSDGGFVITGTKSLFNDDAFIIKTDANGNTCQAVESFGTIQTTMPSYIVNTGTYNPNAFATSSGGNIDSIGVLTSICTSSSPMNIVLNGVQQCYGLCEGTVDAVSTGGLSPYTYSWSTGQSSSGLYSVCSGSYSVTVTDALGHTSTASTYLSPLDSIGYVLSTTNATCNMLDDGSASIVITDGVAPFAPMWSTGLAATSVTNLYPGVYWVEVGDDNGCALRDTFNITQLDPIITSTSGVAASCGTCADGNASVSAAGGASPYSYSWSPIGQTTANVSALLPGTYYVCVSGTNSCYTCDSVIINFSTTVQNNNDSPSNVVSIYPNPFSESTTFVIQSKKQNEIYSFELTDVLGKKVKAISVINEKQFSVSREGLENGIYFYKIYTAENIVGIGKLVIK